ncbi:hypothetical protein ACFE04_008670 [Oxalis oulophora]
MREPSNFPPHHLQMVRTNAISTGIGKYDLNSDSWFCRHTGEIFSRNHKLISEEGSRLHISLGTDNSYIVSDYEGEILSIIACEQAWLFINVETLHEKAWIATVNHL